MLTLPIKGRWFNMICSGEKTEEYREIKEYYETRFLNLFGAIVVDGELLQGDYVPEEIRREPVQEIIFKNGYAKDAPKIKCKCRLRIGTGREEWGAEPGAKYFILGIEEVQEIDAGAD